MFFGGCRGGIGGIPSDYHDHDRWQILRARDLELGTLAHQQIRLLLRGIAFFLKTVRGVGDSNWVIEEFKTLPKQGKMAYRSTSSDRGIDLEGVT